MTRVLPVGVTRQHLRKKAPTILGWKISFDHFFGQLWVGKTGGNLRERCWKTPEN